MYDWTVRAVSLSPGMSILAACGIDARGTRPNTDEVPDGPPPVLHATAYERRRAARIRHTRRATTIGGRRAGGARRRRTARRAVVIGCDGAARDAERVLLQLSGCCWTIPEQQRPRVQRQACNGRAAESLRVRCGGGLSGREIGVPGPTDGLDCKGPPTNNATRRATPTAGEWSRTNSPAPDDGRAGQHAVLQPRGPSG